MKRSLAIALTLTLAACSSETDPEEDVVELEDIIQDTEEDIGVDVDEDTEEDAEEDAVEDTAEDVLDVDVGPEIPVAEPGEPATIEDAVELREVGPEGACGMPVELVGRGLRRSPYVQSVFTDSARIAWTDTFGASGFVRYSIAGSGEWRVAEANVREFTTVQTDDTEDYNAYDATLLGLEPGVDVCYEVYVDGALIFARAAFHTAWTTHDRPVKILTMGDSGNGSANQMAIRDRMMETEADLFLHLGDMAYGDGTYVEFEERVFQVYEALMGSMPAWPTPGNHEYKTNMAEGYLEAYYLPEVAWNDADQEYYYSFDYGNVHFISMDSNEFRLITTVSTLGNDMFDWLEDDLQNTDADWIIVFMHHPPYSSSERGPTAMLHNLVIPMLEEYEVDLILAGHDHHYERTHRILDGEIVEDIDQYAPTYVVAGGGGAGLREAAGDWFTANLNDETHTFLHLTIDGCTATGVAIDEFGDETDQFTVEGCTP